MSFNNIEIVRLRIAEAQQNGMRDAAIRRVMAEEEGEQKVGWLRSIIKRWIDHNVQVTANHQRPSANGIKLTLGRDG